MGFSNCEPPSLHFENSPLSKVRMCEIKKNMTLTNLLHRPLPLLLLHNQCAQVIDDSWNREGFLDGDVEVVIVLLIFDVRSIDQIHELSPFGEYFLLPEMRFNHSWIGESTEFIVAYLIIASSCKYCALA